jgi:undecaprenyl diphosphate synthase
LEETENGVVPGHIAIIMDGNGRWARRQGLPRVRGHEQGAETVRLVSRACARLGVRELTLYAFSMENWKRPRSEVSFLMRLLARYVHSERKEILDNNVRLRVIGRVHELDPRVRRALDETIRASRENTGLILRLALNYGGRGEIVDSVRKIAEEVRAGRLDPADIDEERIREHLYDPSMTDPDLLIRTAGEFRISNFLLWNVSYTEIHVTPVCWPEFRESDLEEAIRAYRGRIRKFGGLEPSRC